MNRCSRFLLRPATLGLSVASLLIGSSGGSAARAEGVLLRVEALEESARARLKAGVEQARRDDPGAFVELAEVKRTFPYPEIIPRGGGLSPVVGLRDLRSRGLWPILNELALEAAPGVTLDEPLLASWRVGLLSALGNLEDERTNDVLRAVVASDAAPEIVGVAAAALSRLCTDANLAFLIEQSHRPREHRSRILTGMSQCHRRAAAERIGEALRATDSPEERWRFIEALGGVGNVGAWSTPSLARTGEGDATRETAARILVEAFLRFEDVSFQYPITHSLLVIDWPGTVEMLERGLDSENAEQKEAAARLKLRLESSPLHRD